MRLPVGFIVAISALCVAANGGSARKPPRPHLLFAGSYHGNEVPLDIGNNWLALVCNEGSCDLRPAVVKAQRGHDEIVDEDATSNTGIDVSGDVENPVLLVRDVGLKARSVPVAFQGEFQLGLSMMLKSLTFGKDEYILLPESPQKGEHEDFPAGYTLTLHKGNRHQVLFSLPEGGSDPYVTLVWAGDLDGDGKLDLLLNASDHYNVSHYRLWLSSHAKPGELVGIAAELVTTGC